MPKFDFSDDALKSIVNAIPIGVLLVDVKGQIVFSNLKLEELLEFDKDELNGLDVHELVPEHLRKVHKAELTKYILAPEPRSMDSGRILPIIKKGNQEILVQIGLIPIIIHDTSYIVVSMIETTNQILKVASHNDPLTGLANRVLFDELSENLRYIAKRHKVTLAMLFVDLDNFKKINDQYGHHIGDGVLYEASSIFLESIRSNDVVGRVGGDEFVICLYDMKNIEQLEKLSKKLEKNLSTISDIQGHSIKISASIGALFVERPAEVSISDMIRRADELMYKAKKSGKATVVTEGY